MTEAGPERDEGREPWRRPFARVLWAIPAAILALEIGVVAYALAIDSKQLFKDGIDWSYDVALYGVVAIVFGRGAQAERIAAGFVGVVMLVAGLHTLWDLWDKIVEPRPIEPLVLGFSRRALPKDFPAALAKDAQDAPRGRVTVIDFVDFECPFCRMTHAELAPLVKLIEDLVGPMTVSGYSLR